jgi:hypothetical protein
MATGAGVMTKKQQARWDAMPQEEKDAIDAKVDADIKREQQKAQEAKALELRKAYELDPELWRSNNLPNIAALMLIKETLHEEPTTERTFMENYKGKIRELSRVTDTALERSLVEYAAVCWLRLQCVDMAYTQHDSGTFDSLDYWDRHLSAAQRRFDKACLDLAKVRRLALPVLQLNIAGKQQVNNVGQVNKA